MDDKKTTAFDHLVEEFLEKHRAASIGSTTPPPPSPPPPPSFSPSPSPPSSPPPNQADITAALHRVCPDTMQPRRCRTYWRNCKPRGSIFKCPFFPSPECSEGFIHGGWMHVQLSCKVSTLVDCKKTFTHPNPEIGEYQCYQKVEYVHLLSTCKALQQEGWCEKYQDGRGDCKWGHDFPDIRIGIVRARNQMDYENSIAVGSKLVGGSSTRGQKDARSP